MLGASGMVNKDQVEDCVNRGWIVLVPNHRLCPQVNLLEGPIQDIRDLLAWIYDGGLQKDLSSKQGADEYKVDIDHVFAFGTSSGGTLALSLVCHEAPQETSDTETNIALCRVSMYQDLWLESLTCMDRAILRMHSGHHRSHK